MNKHLSEEQLAKCFVGVSANEERQHLLECAECNAELSGLGHTVSSFRHAIRGQVDARVESQPLTGISIQPAAQGIRKLGWVLVTAAVLVIGIVPLLTSRKPQIEAGSTGTIPVQTSPDDLMKAINAHLSRTIPAPMEPMMTLIPNDEPTTE
jgi:hypothetical protein